MPNRPPIDMGMYDPARYGVAARGGGGGILAAVKHDEFSTTAVETELKLASSGEALTIPVKVSTTVWDIKELIADRVGVRPTDLQFFAKQGCYVREQRDCEEIRRKVTVKGISSFVRQRMVHPHPLTVIGAGHIGLRQAMIFMKYKDYNFVIFDRKPKVGGAAWWDQANSTSKLQTEYGVYHLNWDETLAPPPIEEDYPWPSRDWLLQHFDQKAHEFGIIPYIRFNTNVMEIEVSGAKENTEYKLKLEKTDGTTREDDTFMTSGIMLYPGNLSVARRETYKGEDEFGGIIAYGMFNEIDYNLLVGIDVAIIGHGAFAVENVRTCMEYGAGQLYLICRRKNLSVPRFVSWLANQSLTPVSASLFLNAMLPMYNLVGYDPWTYYAVQTNASRTNCTIMQKVRFGIGDVYFLAISWGKLEVIVDPGCVKRLTPGSLHCASGRRIDVRAILKLLGFIGNFDNDRLMRVKEMYGFWVNDDPKRYLVAEPISVMASNFAGTSFSPGAIAWAEMGMWFMHYPQDWYSKIQEQGYGLMPRHKTNGEDVPAYVVDARHGTQTMMIVSSLIPFIAERSPIEVGLKHSRMWLLHPIDKFLQYCKEDWDHYCDKLRKEGRTGPEFPYTKEVGCKILEDYNKEHDQSMAKQTGLAGPAAP